MSVNLLQVWSVDVAILTNLIFHFVMEHDTRNGCYGYQTCSTNLLLSLGLVKLIFFLDLTCTCLVDLQSTKVLHLIYIDREYCTLTFRR